jgi:hypothetical protein
MRALVLLVALAACDSPSPRFAGAERSQVSQDGRDYVVYRAGSDVQVIRLGYARRGEHAAIRGAMPQVAALATGCTALPASFDGDSGMMRGRVDCPG